MTCFRFHLVQRARVSSLFEDSDEEAAAVSSPQVRNSTSKSTEKKLWLSGFPEGRPLLGPASCASAA